MTAMARVCLAALLLAAPLTSESLAATVDPRIWEDLDSSGSATFLVVLRTQAETTSIAERTRDRHAQGVAVYDALRASAQRTQADLVATLDALGVSYQPFWIANAIAVRGDRALVTLLASRPDVLSLDADRSFHVPLEPPARFEASREILPATDAIEWNITKINAPAAWALGHTGQGFVYASADTGVDWQHPALKPQYAGWDGATVDHNYHWWDAVKTPIGSPVSPCGYDLQAPCDDLYHGTATTGIAVGGDGATNVIGVAPGATWIACRNMDYGTGRPTTYLGCLQFFLAPTTLAGTNPDPDKRPDVIGNSYSCPPSELCSPTTFTTAIQNLRAAGILVVSSAGNQGSACSSIVDPPGIADDSTTVGATNSSDAIASFSGRGPVTIDGSGRRKPDVVAPGVGIRTSTLGGGYASYSGNSMAVPHVAGAVLILLSASPATMRRDADALEARLEQTAIALTTTQGCGGDTAAQVPNNVYGYGRVDVIAAIGGVVPAPTITAVTPASGPSEVSTNVTITGSGFVAGLTSVAFGTLQAPTVTVSSPTMLVAATPTSGPATVDVSVTAPGGTATRSVAFTFLPRPTLTVQRFGGGSGTVTSLTPPVAINCGGLCAAPFVHGTAITLRATADAGSGFMGWSGGGCSGTGDCVITLTASTTVTATFEVGGVYTRYLAEGATSAMFDTRLALLNPGIVATTATLTFARSGASEVVTTMPVPARTRVTFGPKVLAGMATAEFSTKVESSQRLVVDRTVSWDVANAYGAHAETAIPAPATTWYLAEGATHSGFNLFYLLQNPNASSANVRVRFLRPSGAPLEKTYTLPPDSRNNIWVNEEVFDGLGKALSSTDVSAVIESLSGQPLIVERALYLDRPGQVFAAGHESAGVTAPALEWFLAEGNTGGYFDLFVLVANPGATDAQIEATYLLPDGTSVVVPHTVLANSRFNIWVDEEDPRLANTAVSTTIRSTNGTPVIVERALWWPGAFSQWYEAHNSPGATTTGTRWALAEGEVGGARNVETYILLANTSAFAGDVLVTLLFEEGTSVERTFTVAPRSRFNVDVRTEFAAALDRRFGALVESQGASTAQLVVERAMYWNASGQDWAAGTNALATRLP